MIGKTITKQEFLNSKLINDTNMEQIYNEILEDYMNKGSENMGAVKSILEKIENKELQIVGVKYKDKYGDGYSSKEYSYLADMSIKLYDRVIAETRYGSQRALVTSLNIPFEKVEKFADNLKFVTKEEVKEKEQENLEE